MQRLADLPCFRAHRGLLHLGSRPQDHGSRMHKYISLCTGKSPSRTLCMAFQLHRIWLSFGPERDLTW